jgi:hypothetical protein
MNIKEALKIISKEWPCDHASYERIGFGGSQGRCTDCGATITIANLPKYEKEVKDFSDALNFIQSLEEPVEEIETVSSEVKLWAIVHSNDGRVYRSGDKEQMERIISPTPGNVFKVVEMTGTYEKRVKPKVKHREEFTIRSMAYTKESERPISNNARFFAEWEE